MKKIELLAPAGNNEKLVTACNFGADATYFAGKHFGLRAYAGNFDNDQLKNQVEYVHSLGKKAYITLNIIAHNIDFKELEEYIKFLANIKADAVIVADLGIVSFVKKYAPTLDIHISTQANITNKYSAMEFVNLGATRLILARELSLAEIKEIRAFIPENIELETFVHGAMCMAYSGRCLLSNYLTGRNANCGECAQPCRWEYQITEKKRKGENYEIVEDERGTYILNSKDLNFIRHLDELYKAGVTSFKIEGRMKSVYYVATVVNAYRRAINLLEKAPNTYQVPEELEKELEKASHRRYTTGFYMGNEARNYIEDSSPIQTHKFMGVVLENSKDGYVLIEQRNKFQLGDILEVLSTTDTFNKLIKVVTLKNEDNEEIEIANQVKQKLYIKTDLKLTVGDILRKQK